MRIRCFKPEILQMPDFASLSDGAARLFFGLPLVADDYGRCPANPGFLLGHIFSGKPRPVNTISRFRGELESAGWIRVYTVRGSEYLEIVGWSKVGSATYQLIKKTRQARFPGPSTESEPPTAPPVDTPPEPPDLDLDLDQEHEREREGNTTTTLPPSWLPSSEAISRARAFGLDPEREAAKFRDHHRAKGLHLADWDAAFQLWLERGRDFAKRTATHRPRMHASGDHPIEFRFGDPDYERTLPGYTPDPDDEAA